MIAVRLFAVLAITLLAAPAWSQVEGRDFTRLTPPQTPGSPGKVEVVEFFSYACPHCHALDPLISKWEADLPANAVLVQVPVAFGRREWGQLVRAHYALESIGALDRLGHALFKAIHEENQPLFNEETIAAWVATQGADAAGFRTAFNSAAVSAKATRAEQMSRDYQVSGVPHLAVDGKYVVAGHSYEDMLKTARQLIDKSTTGKQGGKQ